jgi:hypothetical protein
MADKPGDLSFDESALAPTVARMAQIPNAKNGDRNKPFSIRETRSRSLDSFEQFGKDRCGIKNRFSDLSRRSTMT